MNIYLHAKFQVQWCYGFGGTLFNMVKRKEKKKKKKKKKTNNMKKQCFAVFPDVMSKYFYFW